VVLINLKSVDYGRSDQWKSSGLVANEMNKQLDFAAC